MSAIIIIDNKPTEVSDEACREIMRLRSENAALRAALKCERYWVVALTKDNGLLLQAADSTNAGALAVRQNGRIEKLEENNTALLNAIKDIALLTANGDAERANWVALGILNDPRAAIDAARKEAQP